MTPPPATGTKDRVSCLGSDCRKTKKTEKEHTIDTEFRALVEEAQALGAVCNQLGQTTAKRADIDIGAVVGLGDLVAASQLSLSAALGLGLGDGHVVGNTPEAVSGKSNSGCGEGEDGGGEAHCVKMEFGMFGMNRERQRQDDCAMRRCW